MVAPGAGHSAYPSSYTRSRIWDVFAIGALLAGLLAFERGRDGVAGTAFGAGAAIKLFPGVVVLPLVALRWARGDRRGGLRFAGWSAATVLVFNLPFLVANPSGWWWPFHFQGDRNATWGSAWFYILRNAGAPVHGLSGARFANVVSFIALAAALAWLVVVTVRRRLPPFAVVAAAVTLFLLCNKVYSPTYDVWLVVFFVLLPLSRRLWITFCLVDVGVYITVYGHFHTIMSTQFVHIVLPVLVTLRSLVLFVIVRDVTRTPSDA